jgi:gliding motility-associated-like protein
MKRIILLVLIGFSSFANNTAYSQCSGYCGGFSWAGFCYCDDACWLFGDCCMDMCTACPGIGPNTIANCVPPPPPCVPAPVPQDGCYGLVISLDPTCCNTAWTPACQATYDACTQVSFPYTGAPTSWTVPNCVTNITITAEGAQGGNASSTSGAPVAGGQGAVVVASIPVSTGDVVDMTIGGQGGVGTAPGYNGGGTGFFSMDGNINNASGSGGGSTNVNINGTPTIIAAGGGGAGGGSWSTSENNFGGDGGCTNGEAQSPGSPWIGVGGGGGTQTGPGAGGAPWAGVPPGGSPGVGGVGGMGGQWNTAPGGGGGGGYYGGGGGGNDGCCTGANGGAGGGGGSSLIPAGAGCTQGANAGNGSVTIAYIGGGATATITPGLICEGATVTVELIGATGTIQWEESTDGGVTFTPIPGATTAIYTTGALFQDMCYRAEEIGGSCTLTPYSNTVCVTVSPMPAPDAGLDDSLCHSTTTGYPLAGTGSVGGNITWTMTGTPSGTPAPPNTIYAPNNTTLNTTATTNYPGTYTYTLTETDPTGVCPNGTDDVVIFFAKETHTTAFTDPTCFGYTDGTITITSTGNPGAVLYSFDGGPMQASNTQGGFAAGTYTVISQDVVGCTASSNVTLTDPPAVTISVSNDTTVCQNGTATVSASATGGTSYDFHWSQTASLAASQPVSPTAPTSVDVYAENEFGCISPTETITISMHAPIALTISPNDTVCPGYASGMTVNANGGYMGYNYSWTANGAGFPGGSNTIAVNPAIQTQYCVTVSDACETTPVNICSNVLMREVPNPIFTSDTTQGCAPTPIVFTNLTTLTSGAWIDSVTWNIEGVITHDPLGASHNFENVGSYDVYLQVYTNFGCFSSITVPDYITIHAKPEAMFYSNPNPTTIFNTEVDLTDLSTPGANTYQWFVPGATPATSTEQNPTVLYPEGVAGEYLVSMIVTNEFNCFDSTSAIVTIISDVILYAPNVFTPDGDEFNETWRVYIDGIDIYDFHLTIFNRWGEVVWESYNPEGVWDGRYGDADSRNATYVWVIEVKDANSDKKHEFRGHVTVLK